MLIYTTTDNAEDKKKNEMDFVLTTRAGNGNATREM